MKKEPLDQKHEEERVGIWGRQESGDNRHRASRLGVVLCCCVVPVVSWSGELPCCVCTAFILPCFAAVTSGKGDKKGCVDCVT